MEDGHEALTRVRVRLAEVDTSGHVVCIHIPTACAIALGARSAITRLRPRIVEELPTFPIDRIDSLEDFTFAVYYAHALCAPRRRANPEATAAYEEARLLRAELVEAARVLARKRLLDDERLARRPRLGALHVAKDLVGLSLLFRQNWSAVATRTAITQEEVERADFLGRHVLGIFGERAQPTRAGLTVDQARDQRLRCFVLFRDAYDWCQRAATYLRWKEGDAPVLVPPLHPKRAGRVAKRSPSDVRAAGSSR
jgi:hypothetical protein